MGQTNFNLLFTLFIADFIYYLNVEVKQKPYFTSDMAHPKPFN